MPHPAQIELVATILFAFAVLHTFLVKVFQHQATRYPEGSVGENLFHFLGEVEVVFGLWAGVFILIRFFLLGIESTIHFLEELTFTEPMFVFAIMAIAATRPILLFANTLMTGISRLLPFKREVSFFITVMILGPLLGSFLTEPAAMTLTALLLKERFFDRGLSSKFLYATLAVLLVNISIGGVLTHFAAPPVIMVAHVWSWDTPFMWKHFGWKALIAVCINASVLAFIFRKPLAGLQQISSKQKKMNVPVWLTCMHFAVLLLVVMTAHHPVLFLGIFLYFLGLAAISQEYQDEIKLKESLLVGFFLGGLVVLGSLQHWWLQPLLSSLSEFALFLGATALTAITDNAALTYLVSQVTGLSDELKYAVVAGAVSGGGLTVIANAPNPAGLSILKSSFGEEGINPLLLFLYALLPTLLVMICFWLF